MSLISTNPSRWTVPLRVWCLYRYLVHDLYSIFAWLSECFICSGVELVTGSGPGVGGSRDFDAKMSNIKIWKGNENVYKKLFFEIFEQFFPFLTFKLIFFEKVV